MSNFGDDASAMSQLAELLRQASEAGQNASRALAQMRRAYLPAGSYRETDPETLRRERNMSATSSHSNATSHLLSGGPGTPLRRNVWTVDSAICFDDGRRVLFRK